MLTFVEEPTQPRSEIKVSTRPRIHFIRSLCAVKVLLATLRSTLTVLAPLKGRSLSVGVGGAVCSVLIIA